MPHRQWNEIICPECKTSLGYADDNAFRYRISDGFLAVAPSRRSGQLTIHCICARWFKVWDFTKPRLKVVSADGRAKIIKPD